MPFPIRNRFLLAKIESTPGTDPTPVLTDAVFAADVSAAPQVDVEETGEYTGTIHRSVPVPGGGFRNARAMCRMKGSGVAGTEPDYTPVLQASGFGFTNNAADVTGTATAGAASSITLAAGASAVNDFYVGQVLEITAGTGIGQKRVIPAYNGTTKVASVTPAWAAVSGQVAPNATSVYAIRKGTLLKPSSTLLTAALYNYKRQTTGNAKLQKVLGFMANVRFGLPVGRSMSLTFDGRGNFSDDLSVTDPGQPVFENKIAPPFLNSQTYFNDTKARLNNLDIDMGSRVSMEADPNEQYGYGIASITEAQLGGTLVLPQALPSERDTLGLVRSGASQTLTALWGTVAGNRIAMLIKGMVFQTPGEQEVEGMDYESIPWRMDDPLNGLMFYLW